MADRPNPGSGSGYLFLNSPFGDTTYTKVFVGGLAWETQSETLQHYFEQFGEILEAVVITDKNTGRSKGYGFVTFREPEAAKRACTNPNPVIDGRRANCNLASAGRSRPSFSFARPRSFNLYMGGGQATRSRFFGNLGVPPRPVTYSYQHGFVYPQYGYAAYGPEFMYPQGGYSPSTNQQYLQAFRYPGPSIYPYGELRQSIPTPQMFGTVPGYALPGQQIMQFAPSALPPIPATYPSSGMIVPVTTQSQHVGHGHPPRIVDGSSSNQTAG